MGENKEGKNRKKRRKGRQKKNEWKKTYLFYNQLHVSISFNSKRHLLCSNVIIRMQYSILNRRRDASHDPVKLPSQFHDTNRTTPCINAGRHRDALSEIIYSAKLQSPELGCRMTYVRQMAQKPTAVVISVRSLDIRMAVTEYADPTISFHYPRGRRDAPPHRPFTTRFS